MKSTSFSSKALALGVFVAGAQAFWRMPCGVRSGYGRLDPLVSPGKLAAHAHAIHGSSGMFTMRYTSP